MRHFGIATLFKIMSHMSSGKSSPTRYWHEESNIAEPTVDSSHILLREKLPVTAENWGVPFRSFIEKTRIRSLIPQDGPRLIKWPKRNGCPVSPRNQWSYFTPTYNCFFVAHLAPKIRRNSGGHSIRVNAWLLSKKTSNASFPWQLNLWCDFFPSHLV